MKNTALRLLPEMVGGVSVLGIMKRIFTALLLVSMFAAPAAAQTIEPDQLEIERAPLEQPTPDDLPGDLNQGESRGTGEGVMPQGGSANTDLIQKPDYSHLTPQAERTARLDALFERLLTIEDPETANLVAEEIWAIWLDSGSPSVNFILKRGTAAQKKGDLDLARLMFGKVTELEPDYAEGWSRSGRLAFDERDFSKALVDVTQALIYEPRHFYALWTLGNIFEQLGRTDEAFEAYSEAHKLYPALKVVEDQMNKLRKDVEGDVL